ncbi:FxSxx-COOH system tetratricopeptide repeat protein [Nonomuraea sp. M3C6]|uniref:FxSxx-COOH system tetratricopeptide repeat protein n=1 Tax=Nonomuraea marmarensis TaxID=3351344 RepID=A0ABW7ACN0_9ACTN
MSEQVNEHGPIRMPNIWGKIPARNRNFTGRDHLLDQLRASLRLATTAAVVAHTPIPQALHGLGGVGKTQLVTEFAWRFRGSYDLVWWVSADQPALVPAALAGLAVDLSCPPASAVGIEEAAASVRRALQRGEPYSRWLLIFDNADEPEAIKDFLPDGGPGHVLITSRNIRWSAASESVAVDVFERQESIQFLRKRLEREIPYAEANDLALALGDLPLALEQAAALQLTTGLSTDEYIEALREQTRGLLALGKATEYPHSMTAAWQLSVQAIEQRMPEAATVLRCLAFFGPEPIPRDLFRRGNKTQGAVRIGPILSDPLLLSRAFGELNRFALLKVDSTAGTVQVHRLIQALLRDSVDEEERGEIRHEVHLLLAGGAPVDPDDTTRWRAFRELLPHFEPSGLADCAEADPRAFCVTLVRFLYRVGDYRSARTFAEQLRDTWTATSGPESPDVLRIRRHLANVLWQLGEYDESRLLNAETLTMMQRVLGPDNEDTLGVANSYGASLRALGDFGAAQQRDKESLAAFERVFGPTHPVTLRLLNNLALDHALLSDYITARDLHKLAYLEMSGATHGVGKWDVQNAWNGLAQVLRLCGAYEEACDLGEEVYAYGLRELTSEHPIVLKTAKDLSIARRCAGDITASLELAKETFIRLERLFGRDNPDTMATAIALANSLREAGSLDEALALVKDTLPRYHAIYGPRHPFTFGCQGDLALLHRLRGDADRAREENTEAYEGLLTRLGTDHEYTLMVAVNLASDYAALGDSHTARRLGEESLARLRGFFGKEHFLTTFGAVNLAIDLRDSGAEEEADALRAEIMNNIRRISRISTPDMASALKGERIDWDFDPLSL